MVDEAPPATPADEAVPAVPAPPADEAVAAVPAPDAAPVAPKRKLWPWFVGGGALLFLLIVVGIVVAVVGLLGASNPAKTVTEFDRAFEEVDCALFQATTTPEYQDSFLGEPFTCEPWEENAGSLSVDGEYAYVVVVNETTIEGDTAEVSTSETDSSGEAPIDYDLVYGLVKVDGTWLIDTVENVGG